MAIISPDINPVIFSLGDTPLKITWYSLSYVVGILLAWSYMKFLNRLNNKNPIDPKIIDDLITSIILGIIIGGRLGYVLFYDLAKNIADPLNIIRTWDGGMSFHGGLLGVAVATFIHCRIYKIPYLQAVDLISCAAPIGLCLGRIANFINAELMGRYTDVSWGVIFPEQSQARHASQLYESFLEGMIIFIILFFLYKKIRQYNGMASGIFFLLYSLFRGIIENYREPDAHIGFVIQNITMGQLLSIPMIILGIFLISYSITSKAK